MTVSRLRALALAASALLVLAGCAVPGKGEPGVIAYHHDRVITNEDVSVMVAGLENLCSRAQEGQGTGPELTLLLIGPEVISVAENLGYSLTDAQIEAQAELWIAHTEDPRCEGIELTSEGRDVVRIVQSLSIVMNNADGIVALLGLVQDLEENAVLSPRYSDFTLEYFSASIDSISQYISNNSLALGPAQFLYWKDINGFSVSSQPEWISGE